ncbi:sugar phosphate isomerase/epimerase family protein [Fulvivirgaceae bacterium BMA12]|uniref:Sugar phosphate isomerase/epimerase family protein n=1 Tax=Agaribacillus aureus TaxID=3051825 RepID=A0ABT8L1Z4_9BACT|nr:sugar phosphate isomerase/epimerase family protein [Fulvivirgaceae bacterium BMA12]
MQRLCIHTITTKPWDLETALEKYRNAGVTGITVWQDAAQAVGINRAGSLLQESGLEIVAYCRGGFFPHLEEAGRMKAIEENKKMLDEAAAIEAPMLVLVCGSAPGQSLETSRDQIKKGIESLLPRAEENKVALAIEPLHPMYADTRSAINSLSMANDFAEHFNSPWVGVAVDVYHIWWEPGLKEQIVRCGSNQNLLAFHICDWKMPTADMLLDRGIMGEGCIPIQKISQWVDEAGFAGHREVEIFSQKYWEGDQDEYLNKIITAYKNHYPKEIIA